jgi:hypothetical protein
LEIKMPARTVPTLSTVERLLDEVQEWASHVGRIRAKMARKSPGSEAYLEHLVDLNVELNWLEEKAKHAGLAIEEFLHSLPEEDED